MIGKKWVQSNFPGPQPLPLRTLRDDGDSLEDLISYLDGDFWVSHQVAIPVRVDRCARVGGDHEQAVAIGYIHHRRCTELATLSACSREQKQGPALHWPTTFTSIRTEFLNQLAVIGVLVSHDHSCYLTNHNLIQRYHRQPHPRRVLRVMINPLLRYYHLNRLP